MLKIFKFVYKYRAFFTFLVLQIVALVFIFNNSIIHSSGFFNSSNRTIASISSFSSAMKDYFLLGSVNDQLAAENAFLREKITNQNFQSGSVIRLDEKENIRFNQRMSYRTAKVVNNSVNRFTNFITIGLGSKDGIAVGMGVIGPDGVVGKVKAASSNFATVTSLLHTDMYLSAILENSETLCSINWPGIDSKYGQALHLPKHVKIEIGEQVLTSGFSGVYPRGIPVGVVEDVDAASESNFQEVKIRYSTEFRSLSYVYVIENFLLEERNSLEAPIN
ncbi:MAG: rod shape-determining protein MreC [Cyclobacteriaceae bacterium]|nr:rod shape-determining protein MreC [Cyclobacteriaceae bacterium]MCH8514989.1 rod shape-determining protein MreC [Cyclobacteriaceae bacterium]